MVRGSLARRLPNPNHFYRNTQSIFPFSSSSAGGRGRGAAPGSPSPNFSFTARVLGQPESSPGDSDSPSEEATLSSRIGRGSAPQSKPPPHDSGLGRGHGRAPPSSPVPPSFTSFFGPAGRGRTTGLPPSADSRFSNDNEDGGDSVTPGPVNEPPSNVLSALNGAGFGRGKPLKNLAQAPVQEVNRHVRPQRPRFENQDFRNQVQPGPGEAPVLEADRQVRPQRLRFENQDFRNQAQSGPGEAPVQEADHQVRPQRPRSGVQDERNTAQSFPSSSKSTPRLKLSKEEAVKNAKKILSRRNDDDEDDDGVNRLRGRGFRARGGGRGGGRYDHRFVDDDEHDLDFDGEDYDEEEEAKVARETLMEMAGDPEKYKIVKEAIDEFLPDRYHEGLIEAHSINCAIEFEPEYAMEFNTNPDIDEKPPVPLREALEKVKPFVMAYEGIETQEEWEEAMEDTMKLAPSLKELVDCYSGPDRVTAKQQVEELERVAKTLPESAPASVKRFTDRALLSLQSNPGWGFGKKAQFMDKLVREFSQQRR